MGTEPSLFAAARDRDLPLAHRMRPTTVDSFLGQEHLIGPGKPLLDADEEVSSVDGAALIGCILHDSFAAVWAYGRAHLAKMGLTTEG